MRSSRRRVLLAQREPNIKEYREEETEDLRPRAGWLVMPVKPAPAPCKSPTHGAPANLGKVSVLRNSKEMKEFEERSVGIPNDFH